MFKSLGYLPLPVEDKVTSHTADQPQVLNESQFIYCPNNSSPLSEYNTWICFHNVLNSLYIWFALVPSLILAKRV